MNITNEPLFPVAAMTTGPLPKAGVFFIRFDFLTNSMQDINSPNQGRNYALTALQARELAQKILSGLEILENSQSQGTPDQKH